MVNRIVPRVCVWVDAAREADRVLGEEAAQLRVVVEQHELLG